jgi:ribose transport system substrate-binding protein
LFITTTSYLYSGNKEKEAKPKSVSVILYGNTMDRWESLKQGVDQAGLDVNAEINYVVMSTQNNNEEQLLLIQREIDNGADGILLAADNSDMDVSGIQVKNPKVPIVCIESGVTNSDITLVSADNYTMGASLALAIAEKEDERVKIAIVKDNLERDSVKERYNGFNDKIREKFNKFTIWERSEGENRAMIFAQRELTEEAVDVVVAFDNASVEAVIDATLNLNKKVKIYGIANSDKAVYYLDNGKLETLVYQDEFSIGYIGLKTLLDEKQYNKSEMANYIQYHVVDDGSLYLPENQRVLFPFVK